VLRGTIYLTVSQIIFVISNFILHVYLGRALGPELYGVFGVISAFIFITEYILLRAVYETISKFVSEREETTKVIVRDTSRILGALGLGVGAILFVCAGQIASFMRDPGLAIYFRLFAFIIPIVAISTVFLGAINGLRQFGRQALVFVVFSLIRLISVFFLVSTGYSVKGAVVGLLIADISRLVIARRLFRSTGKVIDFQTIRIVFFAAQLLVLAFITAMVMNIDLLAVKILLMDNFQTGLYTSALSIAKVPLSFVIAISFIILPTISKTISDGDYTLTEKYIKQSLRLLFIFVIPISLIIMATSENCISFLYGNRYTHASAPLNVLLIGVIFLSMKAVMYNVIVASGRPGYLIFIGSASLLIDVFLLIKLVARFGLMGAAAATATTHFLGFLLSYGYVARKFMSSVIPFFLVRIASASCIVYLIALLYSPSGFTLLFYYAFLLSLFFILLVIIKEINLIEIKLRLAQTWEAFRLKFIAAKDLR
jgi:O-antigen/teichoic acid export membrane protein